MSTFGAVTGWKVKPGRAYLDLHHQQSSKSKVPADLCADLSLVKMHCDSDEYHLEFQQHRFVLLLQAQLAAAKSCCLEDSV
ncbi:MAG: hypothetical protein FRX49_12946 [Trebouxia sp. A1-2]|nr:MAG: hypothetical protein FRX49_12946 [Trebouxia sp. A1-2]